MNQTRLEDILYVSWCAGGVLWGKVLEYPYLFHDSEALKIVKHCI